MIDFLCQQGISKGRAIALPEIGHFGRETLRDGGGDKYHTLNSILYMHEKCVIIINNNNHLRRNKMFTIEKMKKDDFDMVFEFAKKFYNSDAVNHKVSNEVLMSAVKEAISERVGFDGYIFKDGNRVVGFSYITVFFESEVGGECVMIEDVFIDEKYRSQGIGTKYFEFIFEKYNYAKRFRIEFTKENIGARKLYERLGFVELPYDQMVIDK